MQRILPLAAMLLFAGTAHGSDKEVSTSKSRCGWIDRGVYGCDYSYDSMYSKSRTLCATTLNGSACRTTSDQKTPEPVTPPAPTTEFSRDGVLIMRGR